MSERRCQNCGMMPTHCKCAEPQEGAPDRSSPGLCGIPGQGTHPRSDAPSCDSAELAAITLATVDEVLTLPDGTRMPDPLPSQELLEVIRSDDERVGEFVSKVSPEHVRVSNVQTLQAQRRALLRTVGELRAKLADSEAQREDCERCYIDVKVKLAEAEAVVGRLAAKTVEAELARDYAQSELGETEAMLASVEVRRAETEKRAEAAEAKLADAMATADNWRALCERATAAAQAAQILVDKLLAAGAPPR
jgi:hypothetical protein